MNRIGIYFAYWVQNWEADYVAYIKKVASLGFDTAELATASLLKMRDEGFDYREVHNWC